MARRHTLDPDDWTSIATRLDEVVCAHSGEDPFEEVLKLLVARLVEPAELLPDAVDRRLAAAHVRWPELVDAGTRTHLGAEELARVCTILRGAPLTEDALDAVFEFLVTRAAKGQKGQYFTPRWVVDAAVGMVAPRPGERVVDPACGSGAFLRAALTTGAEVRGFDQDPRAVKVARVLFAARGASPGNVVRVDSLRRTSPRLEDHAPEPFDVVLTNPPFAGDVGDTFRADYDLGRDRRVERDVLFLERCVGLLRPGGRLAIVLPHNKVGAATFAFAREWLLCHARVAGVVGLGRNTFLPHTSQKACIVVAVKRTRPVAPVPADERVVFYVSERDGKDARGRTVLRPDGTVDHDLDAAVAPLRAAVGA